jgi:hypothetical protein
MTMYATDCNLPYGEKICLGGCILLIACLVGCASKRDDQSPVLIGNAIKVEEGTYFLVRYKHRYGAIQLLPYDEGAPPGRRYEWYYQDDGSGVFTNKQAQHGTGLVKENYKAIEGPDFPNRQVLVLDGPPPNIHCGKIRIQWSLGDWIYFQDSFGMFKDMEIAVTTNNSIGDIDYLDEELQWWDGQHTRQSGLRGDSVRGQSRYEVELQKRWKGRAIEGRGTSTANSTNSILVNPERE